MLDSRPDPVQAAHRQIVPHAHTGAPRARSRSPRGSPSTGRQDPPKREKVATSSRRPVHQDHALPSPWSAPRSASKPRLTRPAVQGSGPEGSPSLLIGTRLVRPPAEPSGPGPSTRGLTSLQPNPHGVGSPASTGDLIPEVEQAQVPGSPRRSSTGRMPGPIPSGDRIPAQGSPGSLADASRWIASLDPRPREIQGFARV